MTQSQGAYGNDCPPLWGDKSFFNVFVAHDVAGKIVYEVGWACEMAEGCWSHF